MRALQKKKFKSKRDLISWDDVLLPTHVTRDSFDLIKIVT